MNDKEVKAQEAAQEISTERKERLSAFTFSKCNIAPGEITEYCNDPTVTCVVPDDKNVEFQEKKYSLSALATELTGSKWGVAGPRYFNYKSERLNDVRRYVTGE